MGLGTRAQLSERTDDVVATARHATQKLRPSSRLLLVDGDIGERETAAEVVRTADDVNALVSVNLLGFVLASASTPSPPVS